MTTHARYVCLWEASKIFGNDIEIYFGFEPECDTESPTTLPTKSPSDSPSINPTFYPTISPTNDPSIYPSEIPTMTPIIANHSLKPTKSAEGASECLYTLYILIIVYSHDIG